MIEKITIKNTASYDENGVLINDLKKINFIYGANATGKTTISNFLASSNPDNNTFQDCSIDWQHQSLKTLVYNKEFRDVNFNENSKLKGVFTLGEATREVVDTIEKKKEELNNLQNEINQKKQTLQEQKDEEKTKASEFREKIWSDFYKKYESDFKKAFQGNISKKEKFKDKLLKEHKNNLSPLLTIEELKEKSKTIFGETPQTMQLLSQITFDQINNIESNELWKKKIIGKSDVNIAQFIQNFNINDWVNQGRDFLQEDGTCPFCQQETITDDFRKQLENYFDESFTQSTEQVNSSKNEYSSLTENLINLLSQVETNEKQTEKSKLDIDKFSTYLKTLTSQFNTNKERLTTKSNEPSRSIDLISTREQLELIEKLILDANKKIQQHNNVVNNYQTEKDNLTQSIWKFIVEEANSNIKDFNKSQKGLQEGIDNIDINIKTNTENLNVLDKEIKELNKNVTSIQPTIDEINQLLEGFGFHSFKIAPKKDEKGFYQIQRSNGELVAKTLSEAEVTFITFLYFIHLSRGSIESANITNDRILVIDDPISSLDSNVLFIVSTLIKDIIKDIKEDKGSIKQLLLLTHNVYFHKEVSFINGRIRECNKVHFWILRKNQTISSIQPYEMKNPIKSSYELLWQEIRERDRNSGITIQNTMRRIIEEYFRILGKYEDDDLVQKFNNEEEKQICKSLFSWINDGSHGLPDDLYIEISDTVEKYLQVFKGIFEKTDNIGHYNMMIKGNN